MHADFVNSKFSVRMPAVFRLTNTSFKNNLAGRIGGALVCKLCSNFNLKPQVIFTGVDFIGNKAENGGAIYIL